jgi:hypothetical protein
MSAELERRVRALESQIAGLRSAGRPRYVFESYTPTYRGLTTEGTTTYNNQVGVYARVNAIAYVWARVRWSAATGTGIGVITLPFRLRSVTGLFIPATFYADGLDFAGNYVLAIIPSGTVTVGGQTVSYVRFDSIAATTGASTAINVLGAADVGITVVMPIEDTA